MSAQPHLLRLLKFVRLLADRPGRTVSQTARTLETSERTVYRYLDTLQQLGYLIDKDEQERYFLFEADATRRPAFTADESALVDRLLSSLPADLPLTDSIRRKLFLTSDLIPFADELLDRHQALVVERLATALREGRQVRLLRYHSTNSDTIADRIVEPVGFADHYATLKAYDPEEGKEKSFKIRRMDDVAILDTPCACVTAGEVLDAFGWSGPEPLLVTLHLSGRAYRLLLEERPLCRPFLELYDDEAFPYRFRGEVRSYVGIGRFVLGLPGEIEVVDEAFRDYLRERAAKKLW